MTSMVYGARSQTRTDHFRRCVTAPGSARSTR